MIIPDANYWYGLSDFRVIYDGLYNVSIYISLHA
jgi:hypothetical protein